MRKHFKVVSVGLVAALVVASTPVAALATTDAEILVSTEGEETITDHIDVNEDSVITEQSDKTVLLDNDISSDDDTLLEDKTKTEKDTLIENDNEGSDVVLLDSNKEGDKEQSAETITADDTKKDTVTGEERAYRYESSGPSLLGKTAQLEDASKYAKDLRIEWSADKKRILAKCTVLDKTKEYRVRVAWRKNKSCPWMECDKGYGGIIDNNNCFTAEIDDLMKDVGEYYAFLVILDPEKNLPIAQGLKSNVFRYDVEHSISELIGDKRWDYQQQSLIWSYAGKQKKDTNITWIYGQVWELNDSWAGYSMSTNMDSGLQDGEYWGFAEFKDEKPDHNIEANENTLIVMEIESADASKYRNAQLLVGADLDEKNICVDSITPEEVTLQKGNTEELRVFVSPIGLKRKSVFISSNTSVATVNEAGVITAVGVGKATITVKVNDKGKTKACEVTVPEVKVTGVSISPQTLDLKIGKNTTAQLTATITPSNATNPGLTWSSNNTKVATVDQSGKVTAKSVGKATITVKTNDGGKTALCNVTVGMLNLQWDTAGGKNYWYENGVKQGTYNDPKGVIGFGTVRGREIYDPASKAWYWLDSVYDGAKAVGKEVWMPYIYQDENTWSDADKRSIAFESDEGMGEQVYNAIRKKDGKWVRYDENGKMIKGWITINGRLAELYPNQKGNTYYYDNRTGLMAKGRTVIGGRTYYFDEITGVMK